MRAARSLFAATLVAGLFLATQVQPALATLLTAGEGATAPGVAPDNFSTSGFALSPPSTSLASTGSGSLGDGASYTDYVFKGNSFGANDLSYVFVINPGDHGPEITEAMYSGFAGYTVDVGYCAAPTCGDGQLGAPTGVGLSANGNTVDFYFSSALNGSGNSDFLVIETNSTAYVETADICLAGTATDCSGGFEPAATLVPEPASVSLLGMALVGFGVGWRRKRKSD